MARPTLRSVRDNLDAIAIGQTSLPKTQRAKRRILQREFDATGDPAIAAALNQQTKAEDRRRAAIKYGTPRKRLQSKPVPGQRKDFASPEGFNECGVQRGRSYSSRAGARHEAKQDGFPDVMRHPTTIGIAALPVTANIKDEICRSRPALRKALEGMSYGSQSSGGFHITLKTAAELAEIFPAEELPPGCDPVLRADELFAYLHWHGVVADPQLSKQEVRRILKAAYPGRKRVCVAKVQPERKNKDGAITHGAQGYLEYSMMDKTEIKFSDPDKKKEAIIAYAKLSTTWGKRNRSFSMGKPLSVTGVKIDQDRVAQLGLMERLEHVKKNWDKLSYAEQFIHLWMSGMIAVIRKLASWVGLGNSFKDRVAVLWRLIGKWSRGSASDSPDFLDYFEAALE